MFDGHHLTRSLASPTCNDDDDEPSLAPSLWQHYFVPVPTKHSNMKAPKQDTRQTNHQAASLIAELKLGTVM
jgi:hypothetical protein